jgi:acetolactate synthase-1/3 small subunit
MSAHQSLFQDGELPAAPLPSHTLSVFTENHVGLLGRVTAIFTRRHINIESLTVSKSEIPGIHRFTIVVLATREQAEKVAAQIERQVEVLKAFVHDEAQVIHRDLALYKIEAAAADRPGFSSVLASSGARVIERTADYWVLERPGTFEETEALLEILRGFGLLEFVRSGRVALTRPMKRLDHILEEMEQTRRAAEQAREQPGGSTADEFDRSKTP